MRVQGQYRQTRRALLPRGAGEPGDGGADDRGLRDVVALGHLPHRAAALSYLQAHVGDDDALGTQSLNVQVKLTSSIAPDVVHEFGITEHFGVASAPPGLTTRRSGGLDQGAVADEPEHVRFVQSWGQEHRHDGGMTSESWHISERIDRSPDEVYAYASNPANLPRWAPGLGNSVEKVSGQWFVDTPAERVRFAFAPRNDLGVLDHYLTLNSGEVIYVPMRVIAAESGSEVVFTVRRRPGMTWA